MKKKPRKPEVIKQCKIDIFVSKTLLGKFQMFIAISFTIKVNGTIYHRV